MKHDTHAAPAQHKNHEEHHRPAGHLRPAGHHGAGGHEGPPAGRHGSPGHHGSLGHHEPAATWGTAAQATLHCLTGCAIGEVLGMVIGTALGWGNVPTTVVAIALAFFFGYALTLRGILTAGLGVGAALRVALAADTLSIAVMELIDNGVIVLWPGAMDAVLSDVLFWAALALSLAAAAVVTTPVNKWMIGRGKGHAVVHRYHH